MHSDTQVPRVAITRPDGVLSLLGDRPFSPSTTEENQASTDAGNFLFRWAFGLLRTLHSFINQLNAAMQALMQVSRSGVTLAVNQAGD